MVCENGTLSSSTNQPSSEYLLTALRELMIHNINPASLSSDINIGRQIKEDMINALTHDVLYEKINNYFELEEKLARVYGSTFTDFLIGNISMPIPFVTKISPVVLFEDPITIYSFELFMVPVTIEENDYSLADAEIEWTVISEPVSGSVVFDSLVILQPTLTFLLPGTYVVSVTIKLVDVKLTLSQNIQINVSLDTSSSSS